MTDRDAEDIILMTRKTECIDAPAFTPPVLFGAQQRLRVG